jgi:hypothetical protein
MKKEILLKVKDVLDNDANLSYLKAVEVTMLAKATSLLNRCPFVIINAGRLYKKESDVYNIEESVFEVVLFVCQYDYNSEVAFLGLGTKKGILDISEDIITSLKSNKNLDGLTEVMFEDIKEYYVETTNDKFTESYATYFIIVKYRILKDDEFYHQ